MKDYVKSTIDFYDQNIDEYVAKTSGLHDDEWIEKFVSPLPRNGKILDVGCAFGRDVKIFDQKGFDTTGIDLSSQMIKKAQSMYSKGEFQTMDMTNLAFDNGAFDGIWCSATLLHLTKADTVKALQEMNRVLKPKGYLYLNLKKGTGEKTISDDRYDNADKFYAYYTKEEIQKLLSDSKFSTNEIKSIVDEKDQYRDTGIIYLIAQKNYST